MTPPRRRTLRAALSLPLLAAAVAAQAPPQGFARQVVTQGLDRAVSMAFLPDGRLFALERISGNVRVIRDGVLLAQPWATLPVVGDENSEQGLLGIAVDPDFLHDGFVYVYYTTGQQPENVVARLQDVAGQGQNLTVLTPPGSLPAVMNHNAGRMVFGTDGMLYVGTGDRGDPSTAQNLASWNGKVLRLQPPNLTVPGDNPFPGSPVFSYGHRNQFGITVEPRSGRIYQTENGQDFADEVNLIVAGGNYGWPIHEGPEVLQDPACRDPLAFWSPPVAPTGTCFYTGELWQPARRGAWFVFLFPDATVWQFNLDATGTQVLARTLFDDLPGRGFDLQMGPDGNLWWLAASVNGRGGDEVGRWVAQQAPQPALNVMAVSNKVLGGSVTLGCTGNNGDLFACWCGWTRLPMPLPTVIGGLEVPPDAVLPFLAVTADDRVYLGVPVPVFPSALGVDLHFQAARVSATGRVQATNGTSLPLR